MKIVIVGGVAAGASTAARARRLSESAEIIIIEKDKYVSYSNCGLPYHIGGEIEERKKLILQTPESLKAMLNIDVRVGHQVTDVDRVNKHVRVIELDAGRPYTETYDKLVLCPGAGAIQPPIPGIEHEKVLVLRNIPDMDAIKAIVDKGAQRVLIVGGGFIGIEIAEAFRRRNLEVDLVESKNQVMPSLDHELAYDLRIHIEDHGVNLNLGTVAKEFRDSSGQVEVVFSDGNVILTDLVVLATDVKPASNLAKAAGLDLGVQGAIKVDRHMLTSDPNIYAAGDAVEVVERVTGEPAHIPLAGPANRQGRIAAGHIFGKDAAYQSSQGTSVVKVFDMTAASTGVSEKKLRRLGRPYAKIYLHPWGHALYYPRTQPMHMKLLFDPDKGNLLGGQIVGYDGVDKRIDVIATALRGGMTVFDFENLELAYAPPYGSAKDPLNLAGFIASNIIRGDARCWYADEYPSSTNSGVIIDVRTTKEYEEWHIPESVHFPLQSLRARIDEIKEAADGKPVFLYCRVGYRSYLAYRILYQAGVTPVCFLSGGSKTFNCFHQTKLATLRPVPAKLTATEPFMPIASPAKEETELTSAVAFEQAYATSYMINPNELYEKYYGFREKPFTLLPDPDFLYLGEKHQTALTLLEYGLVNQAGFVVISGGIGTGKTTLIRHLLNRIDKNVTVGLISNTHVSFGQLIEWILMAFDLDYVGKGNTEQFELFTEFMVSEYAQNHRTVLIIDEAQNLSQKTLEELRMLSNINADKNLVLQIILVGQDQLLAKLRRPELEQFVQRVGVEYQLEPLDLDETKAYIRHRLKVAGADNVNIFSEQACDIIYEHCRGIPRLMNILCDTLLVYGFADEKKKIDEELVTEVIADRSKSGLFKEISKDEPIRTTETPFDEVRPSTYQIDKDTARELFSVFNK